MRQALTGAISLWMGCVAAVLVNSASFATSDEETQKGRIVSLVIGHEPGTGYDIYGRLFARHLGRFLPNAPKLVPQNMPGAGGLRAFLWLANVPPGDGSTISTFAFTPVAQQFVDGTLKARPDTLSWIGNLDNSVGVCVASRASGISTVKDLMRPNVVFAAIAGSPTMFPRTLKNLFGAQGKLVTGYRGSSDMKLAIQRGEANAACGVTIQTVRSQWTDLLASGEIKVVLQFSRQPHPTLQDVPSVYSLTKSEEDHQVFDLVYGSTSLGRLFAAPPGLSPANIKTFRAAFMRMVDDPTFLSDAKNAKLDLDPVSGDEVEKLINQYVASKPATVERARLAVQ